MNNNTHFNPWEEIARYYSEYDLFPFEADGDMDDCYVPRSELEDEEEYDADWYADIPFAIPKKPEQVSKLPASFQEADDK